MPFSITSLHDPCIIVTSFDGAVVRPELEAAMVGALSCARDAQTHLHLADCTGLVGSGDLFSIYSLVEGFAAFGVDRRIREAILVRPGTSAESDLSFYETVARNRGYDVRVFDDRALALAWLRAEALVLARAELAAAARPA